MTDPTEPRDVVFIDCETNGVDDTRHDSWEWGWWNLTTGHRGEFFVHLGDVAKFMGRSQPVALRVGRFLDRYPLNGNAPTAYDTHDALGVMRDGLFGNRSPRAVGEMPNPVIIGSKPTFDMGFLTKLYKEHGYPVETDGRPNYWHHHPIDLGSYAAGVLGRELGTESLSAEAVARMCGVAPGGHSAGGDVTSGGAAYLLLRQAARVAQRGEQTAAAWLAEWREVFGGIDAWDAAAEAIGQFGPTGVLLP